jgi:DeoR/GlpR family transcriptional regulator of sugar metabolism
MRVAHSMTKSERKTELLRLLREHESLPLEELARNVQVSLSTLRRDLDELASEGLVRRKFGCVSFAIPPGEEMPFTLRETVCQEEKQRIARATLELVKNGESVYISGGSTALEFARRLPGQRRLTVITNALRVAAVLVDRPGIDLLILGGAVRADEQTMHGHLTEWGAQQLRADRMIYGSQAVSLKHGVTHSQVVEVNTDRAMASVVNQVILLMDHTKFEKVAPVLVLPISNIDMIVTGSELAPDIVTAYQAAGIRMVLG